MHYRLTLAAFAFISLACSPKPSETMGDEGSGGSEASSASETGGGEVTSVSESATESASDPEPTTGGETGGGVTEGESESGVTTGNTTETVTSANPTTVDPTDDPPPDGLPAACEKICAKIEECQVAPPNEECAAQCAAEEEPGSECAALLADVWTCAAMLTCEQLEQFDPEDGMFCAAETKAFQATCGGDACEGFGGGGPGFCEVGRACEGVTQTYRCEADTCTCIENDVPGVQCPNTDLCEAPLAELELAAQECCGWDWN